MRCHLQATVPEILVGDILIPVYSTFCGQGAGGALSWRALLFTGPTSRALMSGDARLYFDSFCISDVTCK